jgi:hypothetical protein
MGHSRARDNWKKRLKRRKWMERFHLEHTCCVCKKSIFQKPMQFTLNEKTGAVRGRMCLRCADRQSYKEYEKSGVLTGGLLITACLAHQYWREVTRQERRRRNVPSLMDDECMRIYVSNERITAKVKEFERDVWFNGGLQKRVQQETVRGLKAEGPDFEALLYSSAGRVLITLTDVESQQFITIITAEDEEPYARSELSGSDSMGPMGIQQLCCTERTALYLLDMAIAKFPDVKPANVHIAC